MGAGPALLIEVTTAANDRQARMRPRHARAFRRTGKAQQTPSFLRRGTPGDRSSMLAQMNAASRENGPINILRSIAALAVVLGHTRILLFVDYDDAPQNLIQQALYGLTAIGHQAVVVFFVLSGYWVGGSAMRSLRRKEFSWRNYLTDRTVRLWVVLIPALVLTLALDLLGRHFFGSMSTYAGDKRYAGVALEQGDLSPLTLLGNILFLGGIRVASYGSNTALWSLGYEFWLYILGPLILVAILRRDRWSVILGLVALATSLLVGLDVVSYLPIWGLGVVVAVATPRLSAIATSLRGGHLVLLRVMTSVILLGTAIIVRGVNSMPVILGDYIVAIPAALLLATLVTGYVDPRSEVSLSGRFANLAHSSYSLYAIHTPILVLGVSMAGIGVAERLEPSFVNWLVLLAVVAAVTAIGWVFSQITERHTSVVRSVVKRKLGVNQHHHFTRAHT